MVFIRHTRDRSLSQYVTLTYLLLYESDNADCFTYSYITMAYIMRRHVNIVRFAPPNPVRRSVSLARKATRHYTQHKAYDDIRGLCFSVCASHHYNTILSFRLLPKPLCCSGVNQITEKMRAKSECEVTVTVSSHLFGY